MDPLNATIPTHRIQFEVNPDYWDCVDDGQTCVDVPHVLLLQDFSLFGNCKNYKAGERVPIARANLHIIDPQAAMDTLLAACRKVSDEAASMADAYQQMHTRPANQVPAGYRDLEDMWVAEKMHAMSAWVAGGASPNAAYERVREDYTGIVKRFNQRVDWTVQKSPGPGLDRLRAAFWRLRDAWSNPLLWEPHP